MPSVVIMLTDRFRCSLERAFAAPILGDATRYLNGYRLQPAIVGFEDDATWGQPNGIRYPRYQRKLARPAWKTAD